MSRIGEAYTPIIPIVPQNTLETAIANKLFAVRQRIRARTMGRPDQELILLEQSTPELQRRFQTLAKVWIETFGSSEI